MPYNEPLQRDETVQSETAGPVLEIRPLKKLEEFSEVVRLQQEIWGLDDLELIPGRLFIVVSKIGGQVLGAYDRSKLVAFCVCLPGLKEGAKPYFHSQMLGVLPPYRNSGVGRSLKLRQREYALGAGIDVIEWTFDPLEVKNAFFNIERLGAVVRRYVRDQYGTTSSPLHGGLPTDRLVAEWWIRSPRATVGRSLHDSAPRQSAPTRARVTVPAGVAELRQQAPDRARELQGSVAAQFEQHFQAGLSVIGFERSEQAGTYLLGEWESD